MAQELTVVVTGSTGKQGGAVTRGLLERGHKVRAVTREPLPPISPAWSPVAAFGGYQR